MRKELFPSLLEKYQFWIETNDSSTILEHAIHNKEHWLSVAHQAISIYQQHNKNTNIAIEELIENNIL